MKNKFLLPLLAVVFAVAGAFASTLAPQMAWYNTGPNSAAQGAINFPVNVSDSNPCIVSGITQCLINGVEAYDTEAHAKTASGTGLLKLP
jgi:hypothetical protein